MKAEWARVVKYPPQEVNRTLESTPKPAVTGVTRGRYLLAFLCIAVLCIILALGLWPFHAPRNGATWLRNHDGLRFGRYSTVISPRPFRAMNLQTDAGASLEIWLQPYRVWDYGTLLAIYRPSKPVPIFRGSKFKATFHFEL